MRDAPGTLKGHLAIGAQMKGHGLPVLVCEASHACIPVLGHIAGWHSGLLPALPPCPARPWSP